MPAGARAQRPPQEPVETEVRGTPRPVRPGEVEVRGTARHAPPGEEGEGNAPGPGRGGTPPPTEPYARAATYVSRETSWQRELSVGDDGGLRSESTTAEATAMGIAGELGVTRLGLRSTARLAYLLGIEQRVDEASGTAESTRSQSLTHGLEGLFDYAFTERTRGSIRSATFWGIRDSQSVIAGVGLGGDGTTDVPGTPSTGTEAPTGTERRRLTRVPYLREDAGLGLSWAASTDVTHQVGLIGSAMVYPDEDAVRDSGERLFETWTAGPQYTLLWTLNPRDTLTGSAEAQTTWFVPVLEPEGDESAADDVAARPIETLTARVGLTRALSRRWAAGVVVGAGWVEPLEEDENAETGGTGTLLGGLNTTWGMGRWVLQAEAERSLTRSEVGAIFATTAVRAGARRALTPTLTGGASVGATRYDVLTQVFASHADLEAFAAPSPGERLSRAEMEDRARRAQEGYGFDAGADLTWQFWGFAGLSIAYAFERRLSDDPNRGDRQVHRGVLGLTLTSLETQPASAEPFFVD